jgi:hypothetical protein
MMIPLRRLDGSLRGFTLVDEVDYVKLRNWRWSLGSHGYAKRNVRLGSKQIAVLLHREIMDAPAELEVDHKDGDRLNNLRSNLRLVTHAQNQQNRNPHERNTSGYRGVYWRAGKWQAYGSLEGKSYYLGRYDDINKAASVAAEWREQNLEFSL